MTRGASPEPEYERDAHVAGGDGGHVVQHLAATCQDHLARPLVTHLPCRYYLEYLEYLGYRSRAHRLHQGGVQAPPLPQLLLALLLVTPVQLQLPSDLFRAT